MKRQVLRNACAVALLLLSGIASADRVKVSRRDPETARLFNDKVTVSVTGDLALASRTLIGREVSKETIAKLVGAPDGATVSITANGSLNISIATAHEYYKYQNRYIANHTGTTTLYNSSFGVKPDAPAGVATRVLAHEIATARELGFKTISVNAAGGPGSDSNGYYTWPRLGFNGPMPTYNANVRPENLRSATDMNSLMSLPGGPEWWKANGSGGMMEFDLSPSSSSTRVHEAYLKAKGISIHE